MAKEPDDVAVFANTLDDLVTVCVFLDMVCVTEVDIVATVLVNVRLSERRGADGDLVSLRSSDFDRVGIRRGVRVIDDVDDADSELEQTAFVSDFVFERDTVSSLTVPDRVAVTNVVVWDFSSVAALEVRDTVVDFSLERVIDRAVRDALADRPSLEAVSTVRDGVRVDEPFSEVHVGDKVPEIEAEALMLFVTVWVPWLFVTSDLLCSEEKDAVWESLVRLKVAVRASADAE